MLIRLKKRREFLAVAASGAKCVTRSCVVQYRRYEDSTDVSRVGFTVTKRQGKAVVRNRIRRRLREAFRRVYAHNALPGWDFVVIGRHTARECPFSMIEQDLRYALSRVRRSEGKGGENAPSS